MGKMQIYGSQQRAIHGVKDLLLKFGLEVVSHSAEKAGVMLPPPENSAAFSRELRKLFMGPPPETEPCLSNRSGSFAQRAGKICPCVSHLLGEGAGPGWASQKVVNFCSAPVPLKSAHQRGLLCLWKRKHPVPHTWTENALSSSLNLCHHHQPLKSHIQPPH